MESNFASPVLLIETEGGHYSAHFWKKKNKKKNLYLEPDVVSPKFPPILKVSTLLKMPLLLMVFDPITANDHKVVQPSFPALAGKRLLQKTQIRGFPKFPGSKAALISS